MIYARVSATDIAKFVRWHQTPEFDSLEKEIEKEQEVVRSILGKDGFESHAMRIGTLIHSIVEDPEAMAVETSYGTMYGTLDIGLLCRTDIERITADIDARSVLEVAGLKIYDVGNDVRIVVSCRADILCGTHAYDLKCTLKHPSEFVLTSDVDEYIDSAQGIIYADVFGLDRVTYRRVYLSQAPPVLSVEQVLDIELDTSDRQHTADMAQSHVESFWRWAMWHNLEGHYINRFINNPELEIL